MSTWLQAHDEFLRERWERGNSAGQISSAMTAHFGAQFSRNAVISRARRLKLSARRSPIEPRGSDNMQKFLLMEELIAEQDEMLERAAIRAGLDPDLGVSMWEIMCANGGEQYR